MTHCRLFNIVIIFSYYYIRAHTLMYTYIYTHMTHTYTHAHTHARIIITIVCVKLFLQVITKQIAVERNSKLDINFILQEHKTQFLDKHDIQPTHVNDNSKTCEKLTTLLIFPACMKCIHYIIYMQAILYMGICMYNKLIRSILSTERTDQSSLI